MRSTRYSNSIVYLALLWTSTGAGFILGGMFGFLRLPPFLVAVLSGFFSCAASAVARYRIAKFFLRVSGYDTADAYELKGPPLPKPAMLAIFAISSLIAAYISHLILGQASNAALGALSALCTCLCVGSMLLMVLAVLG